MTDAQAGRRNQAVWWLVVGIIVFVGWFGTQAWFRHANFVTSQYDLGNMDNTLWHTLHGRGFIMTDPTKLTQVPRVSFHTDFLLLAGAPLYAFWSDPRMLMWLQVLVVASGALPLFWLGRKHLSPTWGAGLAWLYLFFPALQWATLFDFHAVTLTAAFFLWAWWALEQKKYRWYVLALGSALLAKEEIGLIIGLFGILVALSQRPRWIGIITAMIGLLWSFAMLGYVIPSSRTQAAHFAAGWFADFGESPGAVARSLATRPDRALGVLVQTDRLQYLGMLLWPLGYLPLLGAPWLLPALPKIGINLLSSNPNLRAVYFHYSSAIVPFLLLALLMGLAWLKRKFSTWSRLKPWLAGWIMVNFGITTWIWSPLPGTQFHADAVKVFRASPYRELVAESKRRLAADAKVAATTNLAPHFTQREWAWAFPLGLERADAAVVLLDGQIEIQSQEDLRSAIAALRVDPDWRLTLQQGDFYLFERVRAIGLK